MYLQRALTSLAGYLKCQQNNCYYAPQCHLGSLNMMRMLKDHYDLENKKLDAEIQSIQNKLHPSWETDIFVSSEEEIKTYVDEYNKSLTQNKDKKFAKDSVAFKMGRAYKWNTLNRGNFNRFRQTNDGNASDTSTSSSVRSQTNYTHRGFQPHTLNMGPIAPAPPQEHSEMNRIQASKRKTPPMSDGEDIAPTPPDMRGRPHYSGAASGATPKQPRPSNFRAPASKEKVPMTPKPPPHAAQSHIDQFITRPT